MRRIIKRSLLAIGALLVLANLVVLLTGRTYLYKAIASTYLVGKSGPQIDEQDRFYSNVVAASRPRPWSRHPRYGTRALGAGDLALHHRLQSAAYVVAADGRLLFEQYFGGFDAGSITNSFSAAKSLVSLLVGIALERGTIASLDDPVARYLPEFAGGNRANITLRHLLLMSSGLDWDEGGGPFSDLAEAYYGWDLRAQVASLRANAPPGDAFVYLSGNTQILGLVLIAATGESLSAYASRALWTPLEAETDALWSLDDEGGVEKAFCCYYATARDFARIGQLVVDGGRWNDAVVVGAGYLDAALRPAGMIHGTSGRKQDLYGYQWWYADHRGRAIHYARGRDGQYIIAIPADRLVIVRTGRTREAKDENDHPADFYEWVDMAYRLRGDGDGDGDGGDGGEVIPPSSTR